MIICNKVKSLSYNFGFNFLLNTKNRNIMSFERVELPGQVLTSVESMAVRAHEKRNINEVTA